MECPQVPIAQPQVSPWHNPYAMTPNVPYGTSPSVPHGTSNPHGTSPITRPHVSPMERPQVSPWRIPYAMTPNVPYGMSPASFNAGDTEGVETPQEPNVGPLGTLRACRPHGSPMWGC